MFVEWSPLPVLAILFLATFIRSAFGFGEALVAVPLLSLIMPVEVAAPVAVLASITVAGIVVLQDWRYVHFRSAGRLSFATLFGVPLGLILLVTVAEQVVKAVLAIVIISFSMYCLCRRALPLLQDDRWAFLFGFGAGALGGAYGMNGPPLVVYGMLRGWSPQHFRATLQGYFLPASLIGMGGYWAAGLWTSTVTSQYLMALPAVVIAVFVGRAVNRRLGGHSFTRYVHAGLLVVGVVLLWQVLV